MRQTRLESAIEQVMNIGSGFVLAWLHWQVILMPLIKAGHLAITQTTLITLSFTVISVIRGYFWRRLFNKRLPHTLVKSRVERIEPMQKDQNGFPPVSPKDIDWRCMPVNTLARVRGNPNARWKIRAFTEVADPVDGPKFFPGGMVFETTTQCEETFIWNLVELIQNPERVHIGGGMPVDGNVLVFVRYRNGKTKTIMAKDELTYWTHLGLDRDIISYVILEQPYA